MSAAAQPPPTWYILEESVTSWTCVPAATLGLDYATPDTLRMALLRRGIIPKVDTLHDPTDQWIVTISTPIGGRITFYNDLALCQRAKAINGKMSGPG